MTTVAVQRFDARNDPQISWSTYELRLLPHETALDALLTIGESIDPTLAFRRMCRSGICGACAGVVNGTPMLFCQARIGDVSGPGRADVGADLVLQPLARFPVLKDLVVDMAPFFDAAASVEPWLVTDPAYDGRLANERVQQLWSAAQCILCGICESQAIAGDVRHPIAAVHLLRFARDPRDRLGSARLSREQEVGTPDKVFADSLRTVCPKHVDVTPLLRDA